MAQNDAHQAVLQLASLVEATSCSGPVTSNSSSFWLNQQDHTGVARGYAPFLPDDSAYPVYRNAKSYNAVGDGNADDTQNLQTAINDDGNGGNRYNKELDLRLNTILVGNPNSMPVLKASSDFNGGTVVNCYDYAAHDSSGTTAFLIAMKTIIIDTTRIPPHMSLLCNGEQLKRASLPTLVSAYRPTLKVILALHWTKTINGGAVGIRNSNQQVNFKSISFSDCTTAISLTGGYVAIIQNATFDTCGLGVDGGNGGPAGSIIILDSTSTSSGPVIKYHDSSNDNGDLNNQVIVENLSHDGVNSIAVDSNGNTKLGISSNTDTWVWGNVDPGNYQTGKLLSTPRSSSLLSNGKYFTMAQPTYGDMPPNSSSTSRLSVAFRDGSTDDSASLNAILAANAANCRISYFPYGIYIVESTLFVPSGIRIVGQAWSVISGIGSTFGDANNPKPVVQVDNAGDVGVAQIHDMRFTVADITPGAIILQFNVVQRTPINTACGSGNTAGCMAAFAMVHLISSSSAYIENMWGWTGDHSLERGGHQNIATGRGILVEATQATWLTSTAFEHNTLYDYNRHNAQNVYAGLQQTETAYWQGAGSQQDAPAPWTANGQYGDPDFSWCGGGDQSCRMDLAQNIDGGSNLFLYGAAFWTFFHGEVSTCYNCAATICGANCTTNQARVTNSPQDLYWYGVNSRVADVMVLDDGENPPQEWNPRGWGCGNGCLGGVIAGYLPFAGTLVGEL
ncbi:MAG: hypothetical protein ASARMPREDX12_003380 [Alectoria sarmentosa]|nr:MAG: hypothetical protein ASARMPREDX12_003380 [Alectoria sarmentosa]